MLRSKLVNGKNNKQKCIKKIEVLIRWYKIIDFSIKEGNK